MQNIDKPLLVDGHELRIGASIGVALYPDNGEDATALFKHADTAMYQAKDNGKGCYYFYSEKMSKKAKHWLEIETDLRTVLNTDQLKLYYQPQYSFKIGELTGVEALIRWQHPKLGLLLPSEFISIAEETGRLTAIGEWVLYEACKKAKYWLDQGYNLPKISVNIAGSQIQNSGLTTTIQQILSCTGLASSSLELEITETVIMNNANKGEQTLDQLRALGVLISIDDFGTGYSSLSYLKHFPIQKLKIDRSFVMELIEGGEDDAIISAIIALGKSLNLVVLAEGVETEHQAQLLKNKGCDEVQGFLYKKPLSEGAFVALLQAPKNIGIS